MLKIDHSLDAKNTSSILNPLLKHSHPDITHHESDLYKCILNKGRRIARVINDLWDVKQTRKSVKPHMSNIPAFSDDQLLEAIASLSSLSEADATYPLMKIMNELKSRNPLCQKDNFKENLLKLIIQINEFRLLEILLNRPDFDISQVKIGNETPLIYANELPRSKLQGINIGAILFASANAEETPQAAGNMTLRDSNSRFSS